MGLQSGQLFYSQMDQLVRLVLMLLVGDTCAFLFSVPPLHDFCNSLACLAALTANHLIALDKCPGVHPIGVGEIVRRIISKAVLFVIKSDVLEAAGTLQLCAGHEAGCEAAIHSMCRIFHDATTEAVDANNAFNSLNHKDTLFSQEGTTQRDPLAMAMYAIATVPLIEKLQSTNTKQVCLVDHVVSSGSSYVYFVNPGKTWLIVKPQHERDAKELFSGTGIGITSEGKRHLGAALGSRSFLESYISDKVKDVTASVILTLFQHALVVLTYLAPLVLSMMPCVFATIGTHQTYQATVSVAVLSTQIMHSPGSSLTEELTPEEAAVCTELQLSTGVRFLELFLRLASCNLFLWFTNVALDVDSRSVE
eukprot:Em0020g65a